MIISSWFILERLESSGRCLQASDILLLGLYIPNVGCIPVCTGCYWLDDSPWPNYVMVQSTIHTCWPLWFSGLGSRALHIFKGVIRSAKDFDVLFSSRTSPIWRRQVEHRSYCPADLHVWHQIEHIFTFVTIVCNIWTVDIGLDLLSSKYR